MAKLEILAPWILAHEGGYANNPNDKGGATNKGVTIATWRAYGYDKNGDGKIDQKDVKLISNEDATKIMRRNFWNTWQADNLKSQSIANMLVDWVWASGKYGITIPQQLLGGIDQHGKTGAVVQSLAAQLVLPQGSASRTVHRRSTNGDTGFGLFLR